jgi:hypothetical protein
MTDPAMNFSRGGPPRGPTPQAQGQFNNADDGYGRSSPAPGQFRGPPSNNGRNSPYEARSPPRGAAAQPVSNLNNSYVAFDPSMRGQNSSPAPSTQAVPMQTLQPPARNMTAPLPHRPSASPVQGQNPGLLRANSADPEAQGGYNLSIYDAYGDTDFSATQHADVLVPPVAATPTFSSQSPADPYAGARNGWERQKPPGPSNGNFSGGGYSGNRF